MTDPSGAVVPNATVTVKDVGTGVTRTTQTSAAGNYRVPSLPAATFDVTVSAPGFKSAVEKGIRLEVVQTKTLNITLELGETRMEVTVEAGALLVETAEARVSGQINESRVKDLPLVGRNFYTLVVLTPGVTGLPSGGGQAYAQATADIFNAEFGVNLNANGQRAESNSFLVDSASVNASPRGGVTNVTPNADSVQELRVSVNNFSAEYGRNSSTLVNVVTKSGTNDFHGTAAWFHTNNHLTAGNIFQNGCIKRFDGTCDRLPVFRRNEGNWSLGGPVRKDRTFFFASMDILRAGIGTAFRTSVTSPEFNSYMKTAYPNKISTFVMNNFLPQAVLGGVERTTGSESGVNCSALTGGPSSTIATPIGSLPCNFPLTREATFSGSVPRKGFQWNIRVDHTWNESKDRIYGNWYYTRRETVTFASPSIYPAFTGNEPEYTLYFNLNYTHIFSPTLLYEGGITVTRARGDVQVAHGEIPNINVPGIASYGMGFSGPTFIQTNGEWRNVLSWNRGRHSFKFGGNYALDDAWKSGAQFAPENTRYFYGFNNLYDFALDDPFSESNYGFDPKTGKGVGFNFLPVFPRFGFFGNDDWKVNPRLTVNLGLRWEAFLNPHEQHHPGIFSGAVFRSGTDFFSRIADMAVQQRQPLNGTDYNNFAPRFGIAWDPTGKGKMSIRAGGGVFYDRPGGQFFRDASPTLPIFGVISVNKFTTPTPVYGLGTLTAPPWGFPQLSGLQVGLDARGGVIGAPSGIQIWDPNLRTQYAENWFFGIQYAFSTNWVLEGNYIGSVAHKLYQGYDVNRKDGDLFSGKLNRLNPSFGSIGYGQANGNSAYNAASVGLRKRFSHGLDFQVGYTGGKAIDTASSFGLGLGMVDVYNLRLNRGLSDFDIRQKLAASLLYELPSPKGVPGALGKVLGGWQLGAVSIFQSGSPFSVVCTRPFSPVRDTSGNLIGNRGCDFNADGFNFDFPNATSLGNFVQGDKQAFLNGIFPKPTSDTDGDGRIDGLDGPFGRPGLGQDGTLGRNTFIGPGYASTDVNFQKNTKIPWFLGKEGATVQFRAEFFNAFNRVNLNLPNGNVSSGSFGKSGSSFPARNIQFGLKILF